jgi:hypothetical protein
LYCNQSAFPHWTCLVAAFESIDGKTSRPQSEKMHETFAIRLPKEADEIQLRRGFNPFLVFL